jgi:hypothetical protein
LESAGQGHRDVKPTGNRENYRQGSRKARATERSEPDHAQEAFSPLDSLNHGCHMCFTETGPRRLEPHCHPSPE